MNKLKGGLSWLILSAIAIPGCSGFNLGGFQPTDRTNSRYKNEYLAKADSLEVNQENARELVDCYGSLKEFGKMDNVVIKTVNKDLEQGMNSGDMGDKTYKFWKSKPRK